MVARESPRKLEPANGRHDDVATIKEQEIASSLRSPMSPTAEISQPPASIARGMVQSEPNLFLAAAQSLSPAAKADLSAQRFYEPAYMLVIRVYCAELFATYIGSAYVCPPVTTALSF